MARPTRKTVDYFPHYISSGKKMFFIEHKYGNDGYAVWYKILEELATTDNHWLNLSNPMDLMYLSAKCRVSENVLIDILNDLSILDEIDSELWKNKIVWSSKFIESIEDAYLRRNNKCMQKLDLCKHLSDLRIIKPINCNQSVNNNTQSKVNNNKVNNTKEKEISKTVVFDFKNSLIGLGIESKLIDEWLLIRKQKKAVNTETAFTMLKNEIIKSGLNANDCIKIAIEGSWKGFKSDWIKNTQYAGKQQKSADDKLNEFLFGESGQGIKQDGNNGNSVAEETDFTYIE